MKDQRQLAIVDRYLGQNRREWPEPEGLARALVHNVAVLQVPHVRCRGAAQVPQEEQPLDVCHLRLLVVVKTTINRRELLVKVTT